MTRLHRIWLPAMLAGLACAAETLSGPVAGYVTDASRTQLRAILGVPGAFRMSDALALPDGVTQVRLAPGQDFALVERGSGAPAVLSLTGGALDRLKSIADAMPSADWVAFSPAAGSAMLFSAGASRLQVLSGLPDAPRVSMDLDTARLPEQPAMGAVSDDGSLVLAASSSSLYRISLSGDVQVVLSVDRIFSVTTLRNGSDAAVADATTGSIHLLRNAASNPEVRVLRAGLDGIGAIFPSWDGRSLFVARPGAEMVSAIDLSSGEVSSFASSVAPVALLPLRNRDTFLISAKAQQAGWVFYRDGAGARVVFIPATEWTRENPVRGGVR